MHRQVDKKRIRFYDKRQACYYCGTLFSEIARHYKLKHQVWKRSCHCPLATMKTDEISVIARNDELIRDVGVMLLEKRKEKQPGFSKNEGARSARAVYSFVKPISDLMLSSLIS